MSKSLLAMMRMFQLLFIVWCLPLATFAFSQTRPPLLRHVALLRQRSIRLRATSGQNNDDSDPERTQQRVESVFSKALSTRSSSSPNNESSSPVVVSLNQENDNDDNGEKKADIHLPTTGVSVSETMEEAQRDEFTTQLVPITTLSGICQIITEPKETMTGSFDPIRYLVALTPPMSTSSDDTLTTKIEYVMTDIPPYSDALAANIRKFMGPHGTLVAICMTSRTGVHYDEGPAVFTTRQSHINDWTAVFSNLQVIGYRLDIPRDCVSAVTQRLNGYGPWAWNSGTKQFDETGKPLITKEWDPQSIKTMLQRGIVPPDMNDDDNNDVVGLEEHTTESIRQKEMGKRLLAVYTPGHTHGTLSYVFPEMNVVVSGFTIPIEDIGSVNQGQLAGPSMDVRGYITTSGAGMTKQMQSARQLVNDYGDRFGIVLPARSDPLFLDEIDETERKRIMLRIIDQYDRIGQTYSQLDNLSEDDDDDY